MMLKAVKLLPVVMSYVPIALLSACGGGGGTPSPGGSGSITSYPVSATAGTGGTISPASATVDAGGTTTLTVTANSGYAVNGVTGCGGTLSGNTYMTGPVNAACTVTANFLAQYTVTAIAGAGGTISPASATVNAGGTTTLTVTPKTGYLVSGFTGCGGSGSLVGTTYTTGTINAACTVTASFAAAFTWVGGSSTPDANGVYGIQGVAAATNMPGSRDGGVTWTDASGNLWLLGGFSGYAGALDPTVGNFMSDLWKYSPSAGQWAWIGGSKTACSPGAYGTQGVPAATNTPGAHGAAISWTDASGNLWLFAGGGCDSTGAFGLYDALWEYSPSSGLWTWVGGSNTTYANPVYGTQGVPATTSTPGARCCTVNWMDSSGNVWMFGGFTTSPGAVGAALRNDLWVYSPSSHEWTWMGGPSTIQAPGVYGTQGMAQAANVPGARSGALSWTDAHGNFWLFGGIGYDSTGSSQTGLLNDLWEYSPSASQWTWVGGSNTMNATGVYGTQGVAAAANVPPARNSASAWTDASGNLWLLGGYGFDSSTQSDRRLNDLWKYSPSSNQWTWIAGSNTFDATGVYGTQGVAAATNIPGARAATFTWKDTGGNVWLFGGHYEDSTNTRFEMNDLWLYPATQ
jgi:Divergent InlB B-repeat domain/Galactose oxidase, central domain